MVPMQTVPVSPLVRSARPVVRKIGLVGSHGGSLVHCPWQDPSWELWGHASAHAFYRRVLDRYFDLHTLEERPKNAKVEQYIEWLRRCPSPVYMQRVHKDIPQSKQYPKERILMEYGGTRRYFKNQVAWMIALAFTEGVTHLGLFGINYGHYSEYETQRGSAEYWLGRAEERGIHLVLPDECSLLAEPKGLYGYESHDKNGILKEHWKRRRPKPAQTISPVVPGQEIARAVPPADVLEAIAREEREFPRPDWALGPLKPNGKVVSIAGS